MSNSRRAFFSIRPLVAPVATAFAAVALAAFGVIGFGSSPAIHAGPGDVTLVAIDTDISGNDDTTIGVIEPCVSINVGDTLTFDLIVQGVDDADRIAGYQFDIDYDPSIIQVTSVLAFDAPGSVPPDDVTIISRIDSSGGLGFDSFIDFTTNPSSMTLVGLDLTNSPPSPDQYESGDGVLARVTVQAVGDGVTVLDIGGPLGGQDGFSDTMINRGTTPLGAAIPISQIQSGTIAVGEPYGAWLAPPGDTDCDGFGSADETAIGTDPDASCGANAWPPDFDDNQVINSIDVFKVLPPFLGTSVPPTSARQDLNPDGVINTTDVFKVLPPFLGSSCTP